MIDGLKNFIRDIGKGELPGKLARGPISWWNIYGVWPFLALGLVGYGAWRLFKRR